MPSITDKAGNRFEYTTLDVHGDSICVNGSMFLQGKLSDFTVDDGTPKVITPETFLQLFTYKEVNAVEVLSAYLAAGDPDADPPRNPDGELAYWWARVNRSGLTEIQMGLPSVQNGLKGLVAAGVLTEERLAQVNAIQLV